jgi:hypothetical protein
VDWEEIQVLEMAEALMVMEAVRTALLILAVEEEEVGLPVVVVLIGLMAAMVVPELLFCILMYKNRVKARFLIYCN